MSDLFTAYEAALQHLEQKSLAAYHRKEFLFPTKQAVNTYSFELTNTERELILTALKDTDCSELKAKLNFVGR